MPKSQLRIAAWITFFLHGIAALAMTLVLRHGLETNTDVVDRLIFIAGEEGLWIGAWLTWSAAAVSILYFFVVLAKTHTGPQGALRIPLIFSVLLTTAAVPVDLGAEAIEMGLLPALARQEPPNYHDFHLWHRTAVLLTGYLANGLYTGATVVAAWSTRRLYPWWVLAAGLAVGVGGISLSASTLADCMPGMFYSNAVLLPALLVWLAGIAISRVRN